MTRSLGSLLPDRLKPKTFRMKFLLLVPIA